MPGSLVKGALKAVSNAGFLRYNVVLE